MTIASLTTLSMSLLLFLPIVPEQKIKTNDSKRKNKWRKNKWLQEWEKDMAPHCTVHVHIQHILSPDITILYAHIQKLAFSHSKNVGKF